MKTIARAIFVYIFLVCHSALATALFIQRPEDVLKGAPLIVDAHILDVTFTAISNSSVGYATITLSISEFIKGSAPSTIVMRRYGISDKGACLFASYAPTYQTGERVIVSLRKHENGYYKPQGLYNGVFKVVDGVLQGTTIQVEQFKDQIREILAGEREHFAADVPRFRIQALDRGNITFVSKVMSDGSHLGG